MRRWLVPLLAAISLSTPAFAQQDDGAAMRAAAARNGGEVGLAHFAAGRWADAYEAFRRADALYHAPTLALFMAHSKKHLGRLVEARALYQKVVDERIAPTAPLQFLTAQAVAREELDHIERRVPTVELTLTGDALAEAHLIVDGEERAAARSQKIELDPGDHVIEVRVGPAAPAQRAVSLREGTTLKLVIQLPDAPPSPATPAARDDVAGRGAPAPPELAPPEPAPPEPAPRAPGPLAPALAAFGVGAAAIGVGAATGGVSLAQVGDLQALCGPARICRPSAQPTAASAGRLADASTAAFILGGAAAATGIVLVVVRPGGARQGEAKPPVAVRVSPRSLFLEGGF